MRFLGPGNWESGPRRDGWMVERKRDGRIRQQTSKTDYPTRKQLSSPRFAHLAVLLFPFPPLRNDHPSRRRHSTPSIDCWSYLGPFGLPAPRSPAQAHPRPSPILVRLTWTQRRAPKLVLKFGWLIETRFVHGARLDMAQIMSNKVGSPGCSYRISIGINRVRRECSYVRSRSERRCVRRGSERGAHNGERSQGARRFARI
ncbi:hypothetical protein BDV93DRAFT_240049 [Ceratobasidium sp. AG-I]|nr:hypothetical protein BDV93DRAFT_240049 [Ceratobasidium sp. AG-I]